METKIGPMSSSIKIISLIIKKAAYRIRDWMFLKDSFINWDFYQEISLGKKNWSWTILDSYRRNGFSD